MCSISVFVRFGLSDVRLALTSLGMALPAGASQHVLRLYFGR